MPRFVNGILALVPLVLSSAHASELGASSSPAQKPLKLSSSLDVTNNVAITPEVSAFAEELRKAHNIHGISVGVVRLDGASVSTEFGSWGAMNEDGDAVDPHTLFPIGSSSKAFVASAMGILIGDFASGKNVTALPPGLSSLIWQTKVIDLLPDDWQLSDHWATAKLNIRDILTHVSGLTRHEFSYQADDTPLSTIRKLRYLKPTYEPRQQWWYNNQMFVATSHIISIYSGMSYRQFVQERIFDPLGMTSTTYSTDKARASGNFSQQWSFESGGRLIPYWIRNENMEDFIAGAGGIISSAADMTKWLAMLLNRGLDPRTNVTVVPASTFDEMTTAHSVMVGTPSTSTSITGYGMGWMRTSFQGHDMVYHGGAVPGSLTEVVFHPSDNVGIVAFINSNDPHGVQVAVPRRIVENLLGLKHSADLLDSEGQSILTSCRNAIEAVSPRPATCANSTSAIPVSRYEGSYFDPGYGSIHICAPSSTAKDCARLLADFAVLAPSNTSAALDPDTLYAYANSFLVRHMRFKRASNAMPATPDVREKVESFKIEAGAVFPEGYGRDKSPFMFAFSGMQSSLECVHDDDSTVLGCGLVNVEGIGLRAGESIEEQSDVFLRKVE